MCRLYGFRANEPTRVECSLIHAQNALLLQSRSDLRGKTHPDGWGIGYYTGGTPCVERRKTAAFNDRHFSVTAGRVYAETVIAHVRMATVGDPALANTHPFHYGQWLFAHNGTVRAFDRVGPRLREQTDGRYAPGGTTDSEAVFYWLLSRMQAAGIDPDGPAADVKVLAGFLAESVRTLARWCEEADASEAARLNFLLTDGRSMVASRWNNSLHWVARNGITSCEICGVPHVHHTTGAHYRAVDVASEPLTTGAWQVLPDHSVLAVDGEVRPSVQSI